MLKGFRQFIMRGNVVDLAVGVVVGASFTALVNALVKDLLTPLVAALFKAPDFSKMSFTVNGSVFLYGDFINAFLSFIIVAAAVYFFVVLPLNALMVKFKKEPETVSATKTCPECISVIPAAAKRCPFCTSEIKE